MIEMGGSLISNSNVNLCPSAGCNSVGIEHLLLDPSTNGNTSVGGIDNKWSQDASYVNDVNLQGFSGPNTGLYVSAAANGTYPGATNPGPYSNIAFSAASGTPICIDVETQTRGVHGVTVIAVYAIRASIPACVGCFLPEAVTLPEKT